MLRIGLRVGKERKGIKSVGYECQQSISTGTDS